MRPCAAVLFRDCSFLRRGIRHARILVHADMQHGGVCRPKRDRKRADGRAVGQQKLARRNADEKFAAVPGPRAKLPIAF